MKNKRMIPQHEVLRTPEGWSGQARAFIVQLERIHDDIYKKFRKWTKQDLDNSLVDEINGIETKLNYRTIQKSVFQQLNNNGDRTVSTLTEYPSSIGVFRVGTPVAGLPNGITGYGTLLIFDAGTYFMHLYIDYNGSLYYARTVDTYEVTKWMQLTGTEVNPIT